MGTTQQQLIRRRLEHPFLRYCTIHIRKYSRWSGTFIMRLFEVATVLAAALLLGDNSATAFVLHRRTEELNPCPSRRGKTAILRHSRALASLSSPIGVVARLSSTMKATRTETEELPEESQSGTPSLGNATLQEDPFQATGQEEIMRTLAGGPALIFEMARKSMLFVKETDEKAAAAAATPSYEKSKRWYPYSGVQENSSFRTQPPNMSNKGFAKTIWRNVRKRRKGYWRHALRTYDRMSILERDASFPHIVSIVKMERVFCVLCDLL